MLSVLEIWPKEFRNRSSNALRNKLDDIKKVFSVLAAFLPSLQVFDPLKEVDLNWTLTHPKKPRYQTRRVSLAILRKAAFGEDCGSCTLPLRDICLVGAVRDDSSIVAACRPPELERLM